MSTSARPPGLSSSVDGTAAEPLVLRSGRGALQASYYSALGPQPPGPRVGVLVLERQGAHRMHLRLARALAAAGYAVLAVDVGADGDSTSVADASGQRRLAGDELVADARMALGELRRRAAPERVVLFGGCHASELAARCAALERADGIVLAGSRLPPDAQPQDLDVFDRLEPFDGSLLLLGAGETEAQGPDGAALALGAGRWHGARASRHLELGVIDGPRATLPVGADHHLEPSAYVGVVVDFTLQWLERRYGPGYPRAWQGPPPALLPAAPVRDDGPEAQVPLLATGAVVVPVVDGAPVGAPAAWRLELPDGRAFALTDALRRLVALVDGRRSVAQIAAALAAELGRPLAPEQVGQLLRERLAPLGVVEPDARGEGGEAESGMTDILIRCLVPHDRLRALLDNLTKVTRSPYNVILVVGRRHAVLNQNVGLDRARTRYAVFLDDDVLLTEGWLERLRETMDRTGAGAVSARQLRMDGSPLSTAAACGDGGIVEALSGGACFMFRTDLGLRFDEAYVRSQWDDVDFMFQLYERGYKAYVDGRADFYHHNDPKVWRTQNLSYFVEKWTRKGLLRGWALYTYDNGSAFMPCFGGSGD